MPPQKQKAREGWPIPKLEPHRRKFFQIGVKRNILKEAVRKKEAEEERRKKEQENIERENQLRLLGIPIGDAEKEVKEENEGEKEREKAITEQQIELLEIKARELGADKHKLFLLLKHILSEDEKRKQEEMAEKLRLEQIQQRIQREREAREQEEKERAQREKELKEKQMEKELKEKEQKERELKEQEQKNVQAMQMEAKMKSIQKEGMLPRNANSPLSSLKAPTSSMNSTSPTMSISRKPVPMPPHVGRYSYPMSMGVGSYMSIDPPGMGHVPQQQQPQQHVMMNSMLRGGAIMAPPVLPPQQMHNPMMGVMRPFIPPPHGHQGPIQPMVPLMPHNPHGRGGGSIPPSQPDGRRPQQPRHGMPHN